jgi:hypothetical protein
MNKFLPIYSLLLVLVFFQVYNQFYLPDQRQAAFEKERELRVIHPVQVEIDRQEIRAIVKQVFEESLGSNLLLAQKSEHETQRDFLEKIDKLITKKINNWSKEYSSIEYKSHKVDNSLNSKSAEFYNAKSALELSISSGVFSLNDAISMSEYFDKLTDDEEFIIYNEYIKAVNNGTLTSEFLFGLMPVTPGN